jgi:dephospho-CoA kinase
MLTIGLTGGIGSGKSTVANFFRKLRIQVIDADSLAREFIEPNQSAYFAIVNKFGSRVLTEAGNLSKQALREIIFTDPAERAWLEGLLHPLITKKIAEEIARSTSPYVVIVIPLLIETGMTDIVDRILVIDSPVTKQIERVIARDSSSKDMVLNIINSQATREQRLTFANDIILNDNTVAYLQKQVAKLHKYYLQLATA